MSAETVTTETVPCPCGKGSLLVAVKVEQQGPLTYSTEQVTPCRACGSSDLANARAKKPDHPKRNRD